MIYQISRSTSDTDTLHSVAFQLSVGWLELIRIRIHFYYDFIGFRLNFDSASSAGKKSLGNCAERCITFWRPAHSQQPGMASIPSIRRISGFSSLENEGRTSLEYADSRLLGRSSITFTEEGNMPERQSFTPVPWNPGEYRLILRRGFRAWDDPACHWLLCFYARLSAQPRF